MGVAKSCSELSLLRGKELFSQLLENRRYPSVSSYPWELPQLKTTSSSKAVLPTWKCQYPITGWFMGTWRPGSLAPAQEGSVDNTIFIMSAVLPKVFHWNWATRWLPSSQSQSYFLSFSSTVADKSNFLINLVHANLHLGICFLEAQPITDDLLVLFHLSHFINLQYSCKICISKYLFECVCVCLNSHHR